MVRPERIFAAYPEWKLIKENGQKEKIPFCPLYVVPAGIEPASSESESEILSIVLRNQKTLLTVIARCQQQA